MHYDKIEKYEQRQQSSIQPGEESKKLNPKYRSNNSSSSSIKSKGSKTKNFTENTQVVIDQARRQ